MQNANFKIALVRNFALCIFTFAILLASSQPPDNRPVILMPEDRRARDEDIRACADDLRRIVRFHPAVDLDLDLQAEVIDPLPQGTDLFQGRSDEGLAAEARVDRHDEDHIYVVQNKVEAGERRGRIERY